MLKGSSRHTFFECNPYAGVCFHIISYPMSGEITNPTVDGLHPHVGVGISVD